MISKKGHIKKILTMIILGLLCIIVIIAAQNISEEIQINNTETQENTNLQTNNSEANTPNTETGIIDNTTETINLCENINCNISTLVCPDNFTSTCENSCVSETGICTSCTPSCEGHEQNITNQTGNETETIGNETEEGTGNETTQPEQNETIPPGTGGIIIGNDSNTLNDTYPQLDIQFSYPSKITRGEITEIKAIITNTGTLEIKNLVLSWQLPPEFEIISSQTENCGNLNSGESCISTINISSTLSTSLGKNQIKITASYENG